MCTPTAGVGRFFCWLGCVMADVPAVDREFEAALPGRLRDRLEDMRFEIVRDRAMGFSEVSVEQYQRLLASLLAFVLRGCPNDSK